MLSQEELNLKFPLEQIEPIVKEEITPRYVITWCPCSVCPNRVIVAVYDRFNGRTIFKDLTNKKLKVYKYIKTYYGKENCVYPREVTEEFMRQNT